MSNAFKRAAEKHKTPPGGMPEEITAGQEQIEEKVTAENIVPEVPEVKEAEVKEEVVQETTEAVESVEKAPEQVVANSLAASYAGRRTEPDTRTSRISVFVTHSISEKLNESVRERKIKSKNDLINFLLEQYFESEN